MPAPSRIVCTCVGLAAVAGCAASGARIERLDQSSGLTWSSAAEPAVYARTDARYSRAGRDYLYVGPVETNARGLREYFLWVGVATTLDRGFLAPEQAAPVDVALVVGGEPIVLELEPWADAVGTAGLVPYEPPVAPQHELGARITANLLRRIRADGIARVTVRYAGERFATFSEWHSVPDWTGFFSDDAAR